ncbi:MAG: 5'-methylthioadenosine/adenosylhomocysteine nucleosidase [Clostridiales bacterium]|nr:5'-methylthioadenosine/adenosylhomocysteine nucleosidase [Clostridiales bacterium]
MLCIIAAMDEEVELLVGAVKIDSVKKMPCGRAVYSAKYKDKEFILAVSGIGKVNSAVMLQYVLDNYGIDAVINIGTAGAIAGGFKKNDVVLVDAAFQHDYDLRVFGYGKGEIPNVPKERNFFDADLKNKLKEVCARLGYEPREGTAVSGDQFVSDGKKAAELKTEFGARVCEMEAAALLQTAALNGFKNIASIKSVSDNADSDAPEDFSNLEGSKERIKNIVTGYLEFFA